MPEETTTNCPMPDQDQSACFPRFLEDKSKAQNENVQLCSTPPLSVSAQESRRRSSGSPTHFSKKERILQSLKAAVPALFPNQQVENSSEFSRKRAIKEESETVEVTQKRFRTEESMKENKPLKLRGKLTLLVVGENGNVLWKESASKEKIDELFESKSAKSDKSAKSIEKLQKTTFQIDSCQALDLSIPSKKNFEHKSDSAKFNSVLCKREITKDNLKMFPENTVTSQPGSCTKANTKGQKETQPLNDVMKQEHAPFIRLTTPQTFSQTKSPENRAQVLPLPNYPLGFAPSPITDLPVFKSSSPFSLPTPSSSPLSNHSAASTDDASDWRIQRHVPRLPSSDVNRMFSVTPPFSSAPSFGPTYCPLSLIHI